MKTPNTLTLALAAFAGLSFAAAYAAPSYTPDANSPINTTPLNSSSPLLNNYDDYIGVIAGHLTGTDSLLLPTPGGSTLPKGPAYVAAVAAAVAADPAHVQQIVQAAVQYRGGNLGDKVKDILKAIGTANPELTEDAVIGAASGNPAKVADAAAGAVLGVIASSAATTADYGDIVDETIDLSTQALIEKIAKAAVSSAKKAPAPVGGPPITAVRIATAVTQAVIADGGTLYIDDLARGLVAGANAITPTSQADVAAATLDVLDSTGYETKKFIAEFATGALKAVKVGTAAYTAVLNALEVTSAVGSSHLGTIQAVDAAHQALRNAAGGGEVTAFTTALNTMLTTPYAGELEAFMIGAVQNKASKSGDFVGAMFNNPGVTLTSTSGKAIVGAAVRGKFANAAKVTTAAINVGGSGFALSRSEAVAAAIPNATSDFAGVIAGAAIKTIPLLPANVSVGGNQSDNNQPDDVANAAISAAAAAGYKDAINDIALQAFKARKKEMKAIVQTLVANVDSNGWREAIVAEAVITDKKVKSDILDGADLGAAAASLSDFDKTSLHVAANIADDAKTLNKVIFDHSVNDFFAAQVDIGGGVMKDASEFTRAILFGRGGVNSKLAGPLLAVAMRYNTNSSITSADILAISKAIYKKAAPTLDIQYSVIQDALSQPDQLFDLVDHATATHLAKYAPDIAAAAAAARPEYAHIVARAGAFRSPANAGKIGAAAITYGHMTNNRDASGALISNPDDPAAVAAISAATILGIKDAKLPTTPSDKEAAAVKNAVGALVKAASVLNGSDTTFRQSDGVSSTSFRPITGSGTVSTGSAGAVTGIIAEIQGYGGSATNSLSPLAFTAITAAIKADKKHTLEIAQAAAQASQFVYQQDSGLGEIDAAFKLAIFNAVLAGNAVAGNDVKNAIQFGVTEASNNHYGAGAAGILNYAHRSGILPAVTTLENF